MLRPMMVAVLAIAAISCVSTSRADGASAEPLPPEPAATASAAAPDPGATDPAFAGSSRELTATERRWMEGETWHKGCPVPMRDLQLLEMSYHDFDGVVVQGRMVVNQAITQDVLDTFETIYDAGFPIEHLDTRELYPPGQRLDKLRNVTTSFNCRTIKGSDTWSQHAYGLAIDINPTQNPWVKDGKVIPKVGEDYVDRTQDLPGMIKKSGPVVDAFDALGWGWGGRWHSLKDYMHFSQTGG